MSDDIIDLGSYREAREDPDEEVTGVFAVWGGEGERARLALPVWRALYLAAGHRGALLWQEEKPVGSDRLHVLFVLDLESDPPRLEFDSETVEDSWRTGVAPTLTVEEEAVVVFLGSGAGRRWFLVIDHRADGGPIEEKARGDLLFLAGECAGLLLHRGLGDPSTDDPPAY